LLRIQFLLLISLPLLAIVTVKPREVGENPGITGSVSGSLETKRGNTDKDNYAAAFQLQYDSNTSYLVWGMVDGAYGESGGATDTNNLYMHLRYIRNIRDKWLAAELFTQLEEDEFKAIKDRFLLGGGLRARLLRPQSEWGGLFGGLGAMYEYVGYTTPVDPLERNIRLNSYLSYALTFNTDSHFVLNGYYQPKADEFSDFWFMLGGMLEVRIYKQLYLGFMTSYTHDSKPAAGVKEDDYSQRTFFEYKF